MNKQLAFLAIPLLAATDTHAARTIITHLRDEERGDEGVGESFAEPYYGETMDTVPVVLPLLARAADALAGELAGDRVRATAALEAASAALDRAIGHHGGAKAGIDIALHDLVGKRLGVTIRELLGLGGPIPATDFTLGIDEPAVVAERARRASDFPALKVKVGGPSDVATLEAVRAVYDGPLRVDANTGWSLDDARALLPDLVRLGVELIEQPFPARRLDLLRRLQDESPLPLVADESAVTIDDLDALAGVVTGVNVKLAKCGGVGPAQRMLGRARELGFRTFLGCMEETSVGIAASAAVASLADWVDLDGNLLLEDDPFTGLTLGADKVWTLADVPGLGVHRSS